MSDNLNVGDIVAVAERGDCASVISNLRQSLLKKENLWKLYLLDDRASKHSKCADRAYHQCVDYVILNSMLINESVKLCRVTAVSCGADNITVCEARYPFVESINEMTFAKSKIVSISDIEKIFEGEYENEVDNMHRVVDAIKASDEQNPYVLRILAKINETIPHSTN